MTSDRRWKAAQDAEQKYFRKYYARSPEPSTKSQFFPQKFRLDSDFFNNKSVLEVGCSPAATIHFLEEACFRAGIDPLTNTWKHALPHNDTNHIQGRGECLPFADETFDIVLCLNTLDHVESPPATLKEMRRVLKRGGNLLLYVQTFSTLKILRWGLGLVDRPHPHHFSHNGVSFTLRKLGWNVSYNQSTKARLKSPISLIKEGLVLSGLKSLFANLLLGLRESSYVCSKTIEELGLDVKDNIR